MSDSRAPESNLGKPTHQWLRDCRLKRGMDLGAIADETKILRRYFEAIEAGDIHLLPEGIYRRGFIRAYVAAIGVEGSEQAEALVSSLTNEPPASPVHTDEWIGRVSQPPRTRALRVVSGVVLLGVIAAAVWLYVHLSPGRVDTGQARHVEPPSVVGSRAIR